MYEKYLPFINDEDVDEFYALLKIVRTDTVEIDSEFEAERERAIERINEIISTIDE